MKFLTLISRKTGSGVLHSVSLCANAWILRQLLNAERHPSPTPPTTTIITVAAKMKRWFNMQHEHPPRPTYEFVKSIITRIFTSP